MLLALLLSGVTGTASAEIAWAAVDGQIGAGALAGDGGAGPRGTVAIGLAWLIQIRADGWVAVLYDAGQFSTGYAPSVELSYPVLLPVDGLVLGPYFRRGWVVDGAVYRSHEGEGVVAVTSVGATVRWGGYERHDWRIDGAVGVWRGCNDFECNFFIDSWVRHRRPSGLTLGARLSPIEVAVSVGFELGAMARLPAS